MRACARHYAARGQDQLALGVSGLAARTGFAVPPLEDVLKIVWGVPLDLMVYPWWRFGLSFVDQELVYQYSLRLPMKRQMRLPV